MSIESSIRVVKEAVPIERVAAEYTDLKPSGPYRLLGCCPFPHHEDKTPSFNVFTDEGRFKCFGVGCGLSGDVIDLEEVAGMHAETWTAVVALSVRYGVELPVRSQRWHEGQERKAQYRQAKYRALGEVLKRRLFVTEVLPYVKGDEESIVGAWEEWNGSLFWAALAKEVIE